MSNFKLNKKQSEIYYGLSNIGDEIAAFYLDGIIILNDEKIKTKGNLLGHIAREIDGGFRDLFIIKEVKEVCEKCNQEIKNNNYKNSIAETLGTEKSDSFVENWHAVAKNFHRYGHRHGAWKEVRDSNEMIQLWRQYEDVLHKLIGSFFNFTSRIDRILNYEKPTSDQIGLILNFTQKAAFRNYFFNKVKKISWMKPLKDAGFFNLKNHPKNEDHAPYTPYWDVLEFLKKVAEINEKNNDIKITEEIINIINPIIEATDELNNFRTDYYMMQIISTLQVDMLDDKYFIFIKKSINRSPDLIVSAIQERFIPKLLKNKSKNNLIKLLGIILTYRIKPEHISITDKSIDYSYSILGDYQLTEIIKKFKNEIIEACGNDLIDVIINAMKELIALNSSAFNHIWIPTIEDHPQTSFKDKYECQMVYLLRDTLEAINTDNLSIITENLLNEQHYIFKRIAIHIINFKYTALNSLFWSLNWNPINEIILKHEIYELLNSHSKNFTNDQLNKVLKWIEEKEYYYKISELTEEQKNKFTAYSKKEWLSALLPSENSTVKNKFKEYEELNPAELDHPGFNTYMSPVPVFEESISPINSEEINQMTTEELINYLNNYKGEEGWPNVNMAFHGLANELKKAVSNTPMKFINDILNFVIIPKSFQYNIISGFKDALEKDKKALNNYNLIFDYLIKLTETDDFKNYPTDQKIYSIEADILRMTGWLLEIILRENEIFLTDEEYIKIEYLLIYFEKISKSRNIEDYFNDSSDIISLVLNSPKGIAYNNLVLYSLKYEKVNKNSEKNKWKESVKSIFNTKLTNQSEQTLEFHIILGEYLIHLNYLDSDWIKTNLNFIFPDNDTLWKASFTGYLYRTNKIYKEIFTLLKDSGNYSRAIDSNLKGGYADEQLVRHILVSYLNNWEEISDKDSLIYLLLETTGIEHYRTIANFIWVSREFFNDSEKKKRIKELWEYLIKKFTQIFNQEKDETIIAKYQEIISDFLDWLTVFDNIDDEILEYVIFTIKNAKKNFRIRFLIEHLNKFLNKQPAEIGKIFISMLESGNYPTHPEPEIKAFVEKIYELKQKKYADQICNKYGEEGYYFLKELYYSNNN